MIGFWSKKLLVILLLGEMIVPLMSLAEVHIENPLTSQTFTELLERILYFFYILGIPIAAIMIIISGYYFITAMGNPEKIATAKKMLLWILIGFLVLLCASGLVQLLKTVLGIPAI